MSYHDDMGREPWVWDEVRMAAVARQVFARALRRPFLLLGIAVAVTVAFVGYRVRRPPTFEATLFFQMTEGDFTDPNNASRSPSSIREYISNVALSRTRVEALMKKYHLSRAFLAHDRVQAIDEFRDDIDIEVSRNYFIYDRQQFDAPRSAQVSITMSGPDPEQTHALLSEIGDSIVKDQSASRGSRLTQARELYTAQLALARARRQSLQETVDRLWLAAARDEGAVGLRARAEIAGLQAEIKGAIEQVVMLERRSADVAFCASAERSQLGLNLELFDESLIAFSPHLTPFQMLRLGLLVFAVTLLLTIPVVGAFDDHIYVPEDLLTRGLPVFGVLPRFPGDEAGSYRTRISAKRV